MTARFLYGEFFNFTPTSKIWMATKHKPVVKGTDYRILNWLLEGAACWKRERFQTSTIILNATDEYRGEIDVNGTFLKERCREDFNLSIRIRELYKAYSD